MLYLLNKTFIVQNCLRVNLIESNFSPDPPRNVAVQWIKIFLQNKAKSCKIIEIVLHNTNTMVGKYGYLLSAVS